MSERTETGIDRQSLIDTKRELQARILKRLVKVPKDYPSPARQLRGRDLADAVLRFIDLLILLERVWELKRCKEAVLDILDRDPGSADAIKLSEEAVYLDLIVLNASASLLPYLELTAHTLGMDPSPITECAAWPSPEVLAKAGALARRLELMATTGAESPDGANEHAAPAKLPTLKKWSMEAWKLRQIGMTVKAIASALAEKYKDPKITQPRVTEQIKRATMHAEASGLAADAAKALPQVPNRAPARTLDPTVAEMGQRTDGRSRHVRDRAHQIAKED